MTSSSRAHSKSGRALRTCATAFILAAAATVSWTTTAHSEPLPDLPAPGPGTPVPVIDFAGPGRTADLLSGWANAQTGVHKIPAAALQAYGHAAAITAANNPGCGLTWPTLAGIGAIESWHGTYEGANIDPYGTAMPPIRGIALDGRPGIATIPDSDGGALDGDIVFDRAMGPMQFIPATWANWGTDANGDGHANPDHIDDAALSAARYLCNRGGDLTSGEGWVRAIRAYNDSKQYVLDVHAKAMSYSPIVDIPAPPPPPAPEPLPVEPLPAEQPAPPVDPALVAPVPPSCDVLVDPALAAAVEPVLVDPALTPVDVAQPAAVEPPLPVDPAGLPVDILEEAALAVDPAAPADPAASHCEEVPVPADPAAATVPAETPLVEATPTDPATVDAPVVEEPPVEALLAPSLDTVAVPGE